ncbi:MAG: trypsin-like peptidase domain-containing protein [Thermoanaerobaculia bacterium]
MRFRAVVLATVLVFGLGNLSGYLLRSAGDRPSALSATALAQPAAQPEAQLPALELTPEEERDIAVFRNATPSVVNISNYDLRRDFFSLNVLTIPRGTGSGFVWDRQGHVVTNYHVIAAGDRFQVTLGGEDRDAELVGFAADKDLAVLRVDAPRELLKPIEVGTSANLMVGQKVFAIGNPFGLDQTLTVGVVSALGRELESPSRVPIRDVIQTDAAINPGNSGGPLLDSSGRLIGINTAIYSPSGASAGIGFAVPVDVVRRLVPQLIQYGHAIQPGIGIELLSDYWSSRLLRGAAGIVVGRVVRGSPAARAGIEGLRESRRGVVPGDVIVAIGDQPVRSTTDLVLAFEDIGIGGQARITLRRGRRERVVEVELEAIQ